MVRRIAVLPGDGVGMEVTDASLVVLEAIADRFSLQFEFVMGEIGGRAIDKYGVALPLDTLNLALESDAILFGAVGGPKWDNTTAAVRPEDGILEIRKRLGLFVNLRPVKLFHQLIAQSPLRPELLRSVDFVILRELTGGLYFGSPKKRWENSRGRRAVDTLSYSEKEITRVLVAGFELAKNRRGILHSVDKMNVLQTGRLWREIAIEVSQSYPTVMLNHMLVDTAAMQLVLKPAQFDVIVTENTFGDILSDEAVVIGGSMGLLPSASLAGIPNFETSSKRRRRPSLYEPIHGSAPDIAGKNLANPIASILSSAMMLRYSFGLNEAADSIEKAVEVVLDEGSRTADIALPSDKICSTSELANAIAGYVRG